MAVKSHFLIALSYIYIYIYKTAWSQSVFFHEELVNSVLLKEELYIYLTRIIRPC